MPTTLCSGQADFDRPAGDTPAGIQPAHPIGTSAVGVLRRGELSAHHIPGERLGGIPEDPGHVRVLLDELRRPRRQPGYVLPDEYLRVAVRPGADPDGRDG